MTPFCAAVDWGTSQFRVWLLDSEGIVIAKHASDEGLLAAAKDGFSSVLEDHLSKLGASKDLPVIICGMAGSRNGWKEARYLSTPCAIETVAHATVSVSDNMRDIRILPGIAQRNEQHPDVMRGEETQLLGVNLHSDIAPLICLPGTHSKWVFIENGALNSFATFMTGELFALLAQHSVLKFTLADSRGVDPTTDSFLSAVEVAVKNPGSVSSRLFEIRSGCLLDIPKADDATSHLSGLLIGLEIAGAIARYGQLTKVAVIANNKLANAYTCALTKLGVSVECFDAEEAAVSGLYYTASELWGSQLEQKKA